MSSIVYELGNNLYINLTNRCPCACKFCVRNDKDGVGSADSLWLDAEPSAEQVIAELKLRDLSNYGSVVFCGFGEPLCAFDVLLETAKWLKLNGAKVRINTNGLGDLINGKPTAPPLSGLIDAVSISLNAPDAKRYNELCRPEFGETSFDAMLKFASDCRQYVPEVTLTIVDTIPQSEIDECKSVAANADVPLRIRNFI
ncbi:MAG: TIGR04100 family radical SAM protein [Oscillospiraceae bacterium]|jgi:radical SAM enzyme (TIGR04100 family)|nr:TIGR04100 family radical SAM protein [Oscillospiraceae bacterium]